MSAARAAPDDRCYMKLLRLDGLWQLAECGRRFAEGERVAPPFIVCEDCAPDFEELAQVAKDRRAVRKEWDGS